MTIYNKHDSTASKLEIYVYGNGKSNRGTVIVVKRVFSLAKTIVVDVFVIYIPRIPLWYFLLWDCGKEIQIQIEI